MGELGEILPKPLWPIFGLSLFQLSVLQLKELGVQRIYANIHHGADLMREHISHKNLNLKLLEEKALLGSGGAFHNLKSKANESRVLALNCDCLYLFSMDVLKYLNTSQEKEEHLLLGQKVKKENSYNEWITDGEWLVEISGPSNKESYWTFSGISSINLDILNRVPGESSFFKTVAKPSEKMTKVIEKEFPIYDYGTLEQYEHTIWQTFRDESLRDRLISLGAIDKSKLDLANLSYAGQKKRVLNFSTKAGEFSEPGIYIECKSSIYRIWEGRTTLESFE